MAQATLKKREQNYFEFQRTMNPDTRFCPLYITKKATSI